MLSSFRVRAASLAVILFVVFTASGLLAQTPTRLVLFEGILGPT